MGTNQTKEIITDTKTVEEPKALASSTVPEKQKVEKTILFEKPKTQFEDTPGVDLCFMLDCTGSMGPYIQMACNKIKDIMNQIKETYPLSEIRIGIVGYRDIQDANRFDILPFTYSAEVAKDFLDKLQANGGGDIPEDVNGAFQKTLFIMEWKSPVRIVVHIADSPCHGKEFHDCGDDHPKGYEEDLAWDKVFKEVVEKRLDYMFLKISDMTDKMFDKFKAFAEEHGATKAEITFEQELSLYEEQKNNPASESRSFDAPCVGSFGACKSMGSAVNSKASSLFAERVAYKVMSTVSREMKKK